jgi:peptide chain release factor 1
VHCESERSLHRNEAIALARMRAILAEAARSAADQNRNATRRGQLGTGMRGDKRRTIRQQEGTVVDHATGKSWRYRDYERGDW